MALKWLYLLWERLHSHRHQVHTSRLITLLQSITFNQRVHSIFDCHALLCLPDDGPMPVWPWFAFQFGLLINSLHFLSLASVPLPLMTECKWSSSNLTSHTLLTVTVYCERLLNALTGYIGQHVERCCLHRAVTWMIWIMWHVSVLGSLDSLSTAIQGHDWGRGVSGYPVCLTPCIIYIFFTNSCLALFHRAFP